MSQVGSWLRRGVIAALLVLSLIPLVEWIPDDLAAPWYGDVMASWAQGLAIVLAAALAAGYLSRRSSGLWREGAISDGLAKVDPTQARALIVVSLIGFRVYASIARLAFGAKPLLIDEIVELIQARTYAHGRLWIPIDPDPAFRSALHVVEYGGKWFGHFPPGWPALLALGDLIRAPWLIGPAAGALSVVAFGLVLRRVDEPPSVRGGALLLFALAPFPAFLAGSHMNHTPVLMWVLFGLAGLVRLIERPRIGLALATGLAFGLAAITRPADALAFALPAGLWLLADAARTRRWTGLLGVVLGGLVPLLVMLAINRATTGSAFVSGYQLLWGKNVSIGFHPAPWGPDHTPVRGLELINLYLLRLNSFLFDTPFPALLPAALGLMLARRLGSLDRLLLAGGGVLLVLYWAYWHDGFYLGPRFVHLLIPLLVLWTARLPRLIGEVTRSELGRRTAAYALGFGCLGALAFGIPARWAIYSVGQPIMRFDPDRAARAAGVKDAVVLVQESWGAQLLARLWALGFPKPEAERYYRNIDGCVLEEGLTRYEEAGGKPGPAAAVSLRPLLADSAKLVKSPFSPDPSQRFLQGARYTPRCISRVNEDRASFALLAPLWLSRRSDLFFARNLHERNASLLASRPEKNVYLLRQAKGDPEPRYVRLSRDSILALPPSAPTDPTDTPPSSR
jgi:hypothetical protein